MCVCMCIYICVCVHVYMSTSMSAHARARVCDLKTCLDVDVMPCLQVAMNQRMGSCFGVAARCGLWKEGGACEEGKEGRHVNGGRGIG